jgi:methyltransferase (TIGR00027 family)
VAGSFPPARDLVRIRTKYFDDVLETEILSHVRQVVILGAGLDTRAVRRPAPGVRYFEIDDPATLHVKLAGYRARGIEEAVTFIPGNYVTDGVIDLLHRHGFDFGLPTYFIWEGNTMYLPLEANKRIITDLRKRVKRFRLSFDYMAESVISKTTGDAGITRLVESFASMGAPWVSGFRDIGMLAQEMGLNLIENFKTAELHRAYWPGRPLASPIFQFYSVCTLGC